MERVKTKSDLAELTEASLWLASPDAAELEIYLDVQSLAKKSRGSDRRSDSVANRCGPEWPSGSSAGPGDFRGRHLGDLKRREAQIARVSTRGAIVQARQRKPKKTPKRMPRKPMPMPPSS